MTRKILSALIFMVAPALAGASTYYCAAFTTAAIPSGIVCEGGGALQSGTYRNLSDKASWVSARIDASNYAALAATRGENGERVSRMIFPAVSIETADACVAWDARSMHPHLRDSYRVLARCQGSGWTELTTVAREDYFLTTHRCSLRDFVGKSVEVAFETATPAGEGFILAVDNVEIGTLPSPRLIFVSATPRYLGEDEPATVCGTLTNYGAPSAYTHIAVVDAAGREVASQPLASPAPGESVFVELDVPVDLGATFAYSVIVTDGRSKTTLHKSDITRSFFPRTIFIDRFSGTWCNNCPTMELTTSAYEHEYGEQAIIAEVHINDALQEPGYWSGYAGEFVFAIPALALNHNQDTAQDTGRNKEFAAELHSETIAGITTKASRIRGKYIKFDSEVTFGGFCDNSSDRYRVGYLLLADAHDDTSSLYVQQNSASFTSCGQYYYMANVIAPGLMFFDNLLIEASTGTNGVAGSLGKTIYGHTPIAVSYTVTIPGKWVNHDIRAVALVFDTVTGRVLNCASDVSRGPSSSIADVTDGSDIPGDNTLYDLYGRRIDNPNPTPGIYIRGGKKIIINNNIHL